MLKLWQNETKHYSCFQRVQLIQSKVLSFFFSKMALLEWAYMNFLSYWVDHVEMFILFFSYKNKIAIFQQSMLIMPSGT